jgi:hypothetical protein
MQRDLKLITTPGLDHGTAWARSINFALDDRLREL